MVFFGQPVEAEGLLNIIFHPLAELGILGLPFGQPSHQVATGFLNVASLVKPAQFGQTIVIGFAGK
jgi:hypothetical protein